MNKIAQYLNEHILGEVTSAESVRKQFSRDGSILSVNPELVAYPRVTNDIRKIARFSWQLAEKGHILPITIRGGGSDTTGASIGKGIIVNTLAHLNKIIFISLKNKDQFVHVQPGVNLSNLNEALKANGMIINTFPSTSLFSTIGSAVANNYSGIRQGQTGDMVTRLEVVLANGDLIETSRISKRELSKKKGLQTFEGEIYRKIDGIIEDNQQTIADKIANNGPENVGYTGISKVKARDGSFDLTPLLIGSQGTLGLLSEIVIKTDFYKSDESIVVAVFDNAEAARDAADDLATLQPTVLDIIDGQLFDMAHGFGKKYAFTDHYAEKSIGSVVFVSINDFSDHSRKRKLKQTMKKLSKLQTSIFTNEDYSNEELHAIREISAMLNYPTAKGESRPPIIDGAAIPSARREEFIAAVKDLADKHHITLPLQIQWLNGVVHTRPILKLHEVSDKQKAFKLLSEYIELVAKFGGAICAESGEGRLKSTAAYSQLDDDELMIYEQIKAAFDPFGILNTGVKQKSDLKTLVSQLNPDYSGADFAKYAPTN